MKKFLISNHDSDIVLFLEQTKESDLFKLEYRNNDLVFKGNSTLNINFNSSSIESFYLENIIYFNYIFEDGFGTPLGYLIKDNNFEIKIVPFINSYEDTLLYYDNEIFEWNNKFCFVIKNDDNLEILEYIFENNYWYNIEIKKYNNKLEFKINDIKQKKIFNINNLNMNFYINYNTNSLLKDINIKVDGEDIINPYDDFIEYKYTSFYSTRSCSSVCPSAYKIYNPDIVELIDIYKPRIYKETEDNKICTFHETNINPFEGCFDGCWMVDNVCMCTHCPSTSLVLNDVQYPMLEEFSLDGEIQSTHYKIQIDLNDEPFHESSIIDETMVRNLYKSFEENRPVTRVSHYEYKLKLEGDFSGKAISLYDSTYSVNWLTRNTSPLEVIDTAFIFTMGDSVFNKKEQIWTIEHNLKSTNIICQCYDENHQMIYPINQYVLDENVYVVEWNEPMGGYVLLNNAIYSSQLEKEIKNHIIKHDLALIEEPNIVQFNNDEKYKEEVKEITSLSQGYVEIDLENTFEKSFILINNIDKMFYFSNKKVWEVEHNIGYIGLQYQIYDKDWNIIYPNNIINIDENKSLIEFDVNISGYVGIKKIGNPFWQNKIIDGFLDNGDGKVGYFLLGDLTDKNIDLRHGSSFHLSSYDELLHGERKIQSDKYIKLLIKEFYEYNNYYIITCLKEEFRYGNINLNEIGLYDKNGKLSFYSVGNSIYIPEEFGFYFTYKIYKDDLKL